MSRFVTVLFALLAPALAAADGVYFSELIGSYDLNDERQTTTALHASIALGGRSGLWAFELGGGVTDAIDAGATASRWGVTVKRLLPLHKNVELYVRGGLDQVHLERYDDEGYAGSTRKGRGLSYGVGLQLKARIPAAALLVPYLALIPKFPGPRATAALVVDLGGEMSRVRGACETVDLSAQGWMIGIAFGSDL